MSNNIPNFSKITVKEMNQQNIYNLKQFYYGNLSNQVKWGCTVLTTDQKCDKLKKNQLYQGFNSCKKQKQDIKNKNELRKFCNYVNKHNYDNDNIELRFPN